MKVILLVILIAVVGLSQTVTEGDPVTKSELLYALELADKHLVGYDITSFQLVYLPPSERLRREADRLEQKEKDIAFIKNIRVRLALYGIK